MSRLGDADARRRGVRDERVSESVGEGSPQHPLEGNFAPHSRPDAADVGRTAHSRALPLAEGRLLVVSPVSQSIRRVDVRSAAQRNRCILDHADKLFLGALDLDGSLTDLLPLPSHLYKCEGSGEWFWGTRP